MLANAADSEDEFKGMAYRAGSKKKQEIWPTPSANKITESGEIINADGTPWDGKNKPHSYKTGKPIQTALSDAVKMFPTPTAQDYKHRAPDSSQQGLADVVRPQPHDSENTAAAVNGGQLNSNWVELLMGYPQGWTDIEKEMPASMDFPAAWLDGSWEDGVPRVISGQKNRVNRLKCLGNSVLPQIPMLLWLLINKYLLEAGHAAERT
jgi:hypothetical protein